MKQKVEFEIDIPDGKKAIWKDDKVVFEDIKPQLPKTWEEFCCQTILNPKEVFITQFSGIVSLDGIQYNKRDSISDRNLLEIEEDAKAHLALMQLHRLRDCYRQRWVPTVDKVSFGIVRRVGGLLYIDRYMYSSRFLSFQSKEVAEEFLNNFRDLIEQAGDLI